MGTFRPPSAYDAPTLLLSQALSNSLSLRGAVGDVVDPNRLSPHEQDTYAARLKAQAGGNPLSDALIDVASNPLTWLFVVTTPFASAHALTTGKQMFSVSQEAVATMRSHFPWLGTLGALAPSQLFADTHVGAIGRFGAKVRETIAEEFNGAFAGIHDEVEKATGVSLTKQYAKEGRGAQSLLNQKKLNQGVAASVGGFHDDWEEFVPHIKDGELGGSTISHKALVESDTKNALAGMLNSQDLAERLVAAHKSYYASAFERNFGTPEALLRNFRLIENPALASDTADLGTEFGRGFVKGVLKKAAEAQGDAAATAKLYDDLTNKIINPLRANKYYLPQNLSQKYAEGVLISQEAASTANLIRKVSGSGPIYGRSVAEQALLHPQEYRTLNEIAPLTEAGKAKLAAATKALEESKASVDPVRLFNLDASQSAFKYSNANIRTASLASPLDGEMLHANKIATANYIRIADTMEPGTTTHSATGKSALATYNAEGIAVHPGTNHPVSKPLTDAATAPLGGWTVADTVYSDYLHMGAGEQLANQGVSRSRELFKTIVLPRLAGGMPTESAALQGVVSFGKDMAKGFVKMFGDELEKHGPGAKEFVKGLDNWANLPAMAEDGRALSRGTAKYLYTTHLGFNPSSAILNLMQPWTVLGSWTGYGNLAKSYPKVVGQVFEYLKSSQLNQVETMAEKNARILKHIPLADVAGLTHDIFDLETSLKGKTRSFTELALKMFEKAEWINKLATVHAVGNARGWSGKMADLSPSILADMRTATEQANFAGSWWNTPTMFQTGALSNPLIRQFQTFPMRMLTAAVYTGPTMVGGGGYGAVDFARAVGFSAIAYETAKGLFNADISRGLTIASVTDGIPFMQGGRFDDRKSPIPVPPIIDIPLSLGKGLLTGDSQALRDSIPRLIPGGIALTKILNNVAPDSFSPDFLQRTYIDSSKALPDGRVPVYKADGTLVSYEDKTGLVAKSLGIDFGRFNSTTERDTYLVKNREEILRYRQAYLQRMVAGDQSGAASIQAEFTKRFNFPITITKGQMLKATSMTMQPRTDRIMRQLDQQARPIYQQFLGQDPKTPNPADAATYKDPRTNIPQQQETVNGFGSFGSFS